jgi:tRNA modification GTPase
VYVRDTIAAIATPPGAGGIGVIRASGPAAEQLADAVFRRRRQGGSWQSHRLYRGHVIGSDGTPIDDALAVLMRAPRSYTGEDVLELHCHGSPLVLERALAAVLRCGARPARAGEFTKRAFLNGKLDLTQAEAVAALVGARTADAADAAVDHLFGRLSAHLDAVRQSLIGCKAHLEARIDFADEPLDLDDDRLAADLDGAHGAVAALLATFGRGRLLRQGLRVAITGQPNAGKSSLLNALLGAERAIVTPVPGTTRDVIEDSADFDGVPVVLSDTAGLREVGDTVERIGIERARAAAASADVVLMVLDTTSALAPQRRLLEAHAAPLVVANKIDLRCAWSRAERSALEAAHAVLPVSATERRGLDALRAAVLQRAGDQWSDNLPTLTSTRQRDALAKVEQALAEALAGLRRGLPADLLAVDVQAALDHIAAVTGAITSDDVLDAVFAEFCIGK